MASHGVSWPATGGGPQIAKPPPGVSLETYEQRLGDLLSECGEWREGGSIHVFQLTPARAKAAEQPFDDGRAHSGRDAGLEEGARRSRSAPVEGAGRLRRGRSHRGRPGGLAGDDAGIERITGGLGRGGEPTAGYLRVANRDRFRTAASKAMPTGSARSRRLGHLVRDDLGADVPCRGVSHGVGIRVSAAGSCGDRGDVRGQRASGRRRSWPRPAPSRRRGSRRLVVPHRRRTGCPATIS